MLNTTTDYARTHQKIVEIPVEKPVLYKKCEACDRTAYQNAKARYETQKEQLAGQYKAKTVMFQTTLFLLAWYSLTTTLFQAVQSDVFLSDCKSFFHDAASFIQTFIGWTIDAGQSVAQISTKIPNEDYSRNHILVIADIGCGNMCGRDRNTGDTDRNKGYRII